LLDADRPTDAVAIWNSAFSSKWTPETPLINAALDQPAQPPGLDWFIPSVPGVDTNRGIPPGGIKFTLSGTQPESASLLAQTVFLPGGRLWTLSFEFQTRNITPAQAGLTWTLTPLGQGTPLEPAAPLLSLSSEDWSTASASWSLPPADRLLRLNLTYRRPLGQVRAEGELFLRNLSLRSSEAAK